jgi:RHS repeat-associated protein
VRTSALAVDAASIVSTIAARTGSPLGASVATGFDVVTGAGLKPRLATSDLAAEPRQARLTLPAQANGTLHLEDAATGTAIDVTLRGASAAAGQPTGGYVVYAGAAPGGGNVIQRAVAAGTEDYVAFDAQPASTQISYGLALGAGAAGLRLVGGTLEVLDSAGAPRLRVAPPYVVGADGAATSATLAVAGCAVDTNPAPPWGRAVAAPGAASCQVTVTWPSSGIAYPAILDPRWTTTGSMITARQEHTALLLSTGRVLVVGGRSSNSGTAGLATAELYDRTSGTWASTGSMTGGRRLHSMTQLPSGSNPTTSGKVLVAGGMDSSTSLNTAQLYSPSAGTWIAAANLNAPRHLHTDNLLPDGRVLVSGGMNGTSTLQTAALYNPASGSGSWVATTGPIPPPGWRFGTATLIQTTNNQLNNRVLLVGGNNGTASIASVFLFDPAQNAFSTLASISSPREQHTASVLPNTNGKIIVTGGKNGSTPLATALIFDPSASNGTWSSAGTMTTARFGHSATVLPTSIVANGSVLVAGGNNGSGTLSSAELFSGTSTWTATPAMPSPPSQGHTATLLGNNMVLVAGGLNGSTVINNARLYDAAFGLGCSSASQCPSGNCVNGICCDTACNAGTCEACNLAGHLGTCTPLASGTTCRASAGPCDVAETCNGTAVTCPGDGFAPTSTVCRSAVDVCDQAESCPGNAAACPADAKKASGTACPDDGNACTTDLCNGSSATCQHAAGNAGTQCRAAAGVCDLAATCTGSSTTCPANPFKPSSTVCRAASGDCDLAANCTGSSATCPANPFKPSSTVCRAAVDLCDRAENCTGSSAVCPTDSLQPAGTTCRAAVAECDIAETCSGASAACPPDQIRPAGFACSSDNNICTLDICNGVAISCQHPASFGGATCRPAAGPCDVEEKCDGVIPACPPDAFADSSTVCRAPAGTCDAAETCTGTSASCPGDAHRPDGVTCDDGNACTQTETCQSGTCTPPTGFPTIVNLPADDLGTIDGDTAAADINASGQVSGSTSLGSSPHAFTWTRSSTLVDVGGQAGFPRENTATAINDTGMIAGALAEVDGNHAFRYSVLTGLQDIGRGGDGSTVSEGSDLRGAYPQSINAGRQVAGYLTDAGQLHGFRYTDGLGFEDVGSLGGTRTVAAAIDPTGLVVGASRLLNSPPTGYASRGHAVSFDDALGLVDLNSHVDPLLGWTLIEANDVAGDYIVGGGERAGIVRPFRLRRSNGAVDEIFGGWEGESYGTGVNIYGDLVGWGYIDAPGTQQAAFIFTNQIGFKKLNDLIDPASGWDLKVATAINDSDEIVGWGLHNGKKRAFFLSLAPQKLACGTPNACGGGTAAEICLWVDGVVDMGGGNFTALFGYQSTADTTIHPTPNQELLDGSVVSSPQPAPPTWLSSGGHPAAFVPTFAAGHTISWHVESQTASALASLRQLTKIPIGTGGFGVEIGGQFITIKPDLDKYALAPPEPALAAEPPVGDEFNGALTGTFGVSPTGAATFTVPIAIPPGVAGMAPALSLVYNSQGRDGIAGQGWDLAGLSGIHRCPRTRVQDGRARAVLMDDLGRPGADGDQDGLCLDGKRLFEKPGTSPAEYYTETNDFSVITRDTAFNTFTVVTKSGETRFYASRDDARVILPGETRIFSHGQVIVTPADQPAIWLLDRVQDVWGNFYDLHYNSDFADNGVRIREIDYTGHISSGATTPDVDPFYKVKFNYEDRKIAGHTEFNEVRKARFRHATLQMKTRLASIETARGAYVLTYMTDVLGLPSRLQKIDYSAPVQPIPPPPAVPTVKSLKPLEFAWTGSTTSFWTANDASSGYALPSEIPAEKGLKGVQFVDIDADGRPDLLYARGNTQTIDRRTWRNTGHGWDPNPFPPLPDDLMTTTNNVDIPTGLRFADLDGDSRVDLILDNGDVRCDGNSCIVCSTTQAGCTGTAHHASPAVWLNRIKEGHGWEYHAEYESRPTSPTFQGDVNFFGSSSANDDVVDIDGDGRADLVRSEDTAFPNSQKRVTILLNKPAGWQLLPFTDLPGGSSGGRFVDVNRDGLPDVASQSFQQYPDGHIEGDGSAVMNLGPVTNNAGDIVSIAFATSLTGSAATPGGQSMAGLPHPPASGDIDGDGIQDRVIYYPEHEVDTNGDDSPFHSGIALGDGTGLGYADQQSGEFRAALAAFSPTDTQADPAKVPADFGWTLIDANGDGLADLLRNHGERSSGPNSVRSGGQLLINTGTTWADLGGETSWVGLVEGDPVPFVPDDEIVKNGGTFIDLNGDGLVDLVQAGSSLIGEAPKTYLNRYQPPIINQFPKQLAATRTFVTYSVITTEAAQAGLAPTYSDSGELAFGTTFLPVPMRVVNGVSEDNGAGATNATTYQYADLRASAFHYGSQGFAKVTVTEQASGTVTETRFAQAFPYTGLPVGVTRSNQGPVAATATIYCTRNVDRQHPDSCLQLPEYPQSYPPGSSFFVRPVEVGDTSYLRTSFPEPSPAASVQTTTEFDYDDFGNPTMTSVQMENVTEIYVKQTSNQYGNPGSLEQHRGKMTQSIVTTTKTAGQASPAITHTTRFEYGTFFGALALAKTKVEPGGGDAELHTAYAYDKFGNLVATTNCASDFDSCSTDAPDTLPFRTTRSSYDPADLDVAVSYGVGRFPTRVTNAAGHAETTVFEPLLGLVTEKTGPNGIKTCFSYDPFGAQTSETVRCGGAQPLTTTTGRFLPKSPPPPAPCTSGVCQAPPNFTKVVTVTRSPGASPTWTFSDALGRTIATETLGFGGDVVQTLTEYDAQGRVHRASKPFGSADAPAFTTTIYDPLSRPQTVTQDLGPLGDSITGAGEGSGDIEITYQGFTTRTDRTVNGEVRRKYETKNGLGKVASVETLKGDPSDRANETIISYRYDVDGNLTDTFDPSSNTIHIEYDSRGRKLTSTDPDLGFWEYGYNGFGDLLTQVDPNSRSASQTISMTYDKLGRMTSKTDAQGTSEWIYDVAPGAGIGKLAATIGPADTHLAGECLHPVTAANLGKRPVKSFQYTALGDVELVSECTDGEIFSTGFHYDDLGRQDLVTYPEVRGSRLGVEYHYTSLGYLHFLRDASDQAVYWAATSVNAAGQVTAEYTRNGVDTISQYSPATGWLLARASAAYGNGSQLIQAWAYRFDEAGNLRRRLRMDEVAQNKSDETFGYDRLDRLTLAATAAPTAYSETYAYDDLGDVMQKAGKTYTYGNCPAGARAAGPHAVCAVSGLMPYAYDDNGNMTGGADRTITYNPSNKVTHILSEPLGSAPSAADFIYSADGNRIVQETTGGGVTARTVYVGLGAAGKSLYERTKRGPTTVEHVHFLYAGGAHGGNAFALRTITEDTASQTATVATSYHHFDHLGSITAVSDEQGRIINPQLGRNPGLLSYDSWGARRGSESEAANPAAFDPPPGHREFTGHETIPGVGLINMNGRVYDPEIGRFLSPDPNVQFVANLQAYNRYSYALNNPLRYTDPTGYFFSGTFDFVVNILGAIAAAAVCAYTALVGCALIFAVALTAYNVSSAIAAGTPWQDAVMVGAMSLVVGFVTGGIGSGIGAAAGAGPAGQLLGGAIGGAMGAGFMSLATGASWDQLGKSVLVGGFSGAFAAGLSMAVRSRVPVSQSSAVEAQGGGGSGAARVERVETVESVIADAGYGGHVTDQDLLDAYPNAAPANAPPPLSRAEQRAIADVDPTVRDLATTHRNAARLAGIEASLRPGFRTYAEQQALVDAGATEADPGRSLHNFRLAYHLDVFVGNQIAPADDPRWAQLADLAPPGIEAGANWDHPDPTHYEYRTDSVTGQRLSTDQLQQRWESNLDPLSGARRNFHLCPQGVCP